jgi:hypothetical protein
MHYPTDVIAGAAVGLASGYLAARVAMRPLLMPLIRLASHISDPLVVRARATGLARHTLLDPGTRAGIVLAVGSALSVVFAVQLHAHLLDEMELSLLATWALIVAGAVRLARTEGLAARPRPANRVRHPAT